MNSRPQPTQSFASKRLGSAFDVYYMLVVVFALLFVVCSVLVDACGLLFVWGQTGDALRVGGELLAAETS